MRTMSGMTGGSAQHRTGQLLRRRGQYLIIPVWLQRTLTVILMYYYGHWRLDDTHQLETIQIMSTFISCAAGFH